MLLHPGTAKRKKVLCIIIKNPAYINYWFSWTLSIWFPLFSFLQYSRPKLFPLDLTLSHLLSIFSSSHFFELWNNKVQLYFNTCYSHHPCIFTCMSIILSFLLQIYIFANKLLRYVLCYMADQNHKGVKFPEANSRGQCLQFSPVAIKFQLLYPRNMSKRPTKIPGGINIAGIDWSS